MTRRPRGRRRPSVALLTVVLLLLAACTSSTHESPHHRTHFSPGRITGTTSPNIVFVLTDDLSMNLVAHMPHVLGLEHAGTTMSDFHVVDSLCCPSRSATFTGEFPHDDGVFRNTGSDGGYSGFNAHGDRERSFSIALQRAGYRTALMGKYLNGYDPADGVPPGWDEWDVAGNGYAQYNYTLNEDGRQQHFGSKPQDYLTDVLSGKAAGFIRSSAARREPFMLEVATFAPHKPSTPAPRYANAFPFLRYPRTPAYDALPTGAASWLRSSPALSASQQQFIDQQYRKRVQSDLAVDDLIGNLQRTLQATGAAKNTYFVFNSDNGYHMGEYRLLPGKQTAYDTDTHVPLVVTGPGVPAGRVAPQLASNIDLAPTFENLVGARVPKTVDGVPLTPLWHGQAPLLWQRALLIEHHGPANAKNDPDGQALRSGAPPTYSAVRTADALYVRYRNGQQEYYDTQTDPNELHNIAAAGVPPALTHTLVALTTCHGAAQCQAAAGAP
ncbi:sulfatase [uncultured Jatrophihabitans sp.]|uniref:sulfatase family protein n=1 Tax=uncultured Jatrophihabitans sp. TaxID=1610747 RepID=UPI0035CC9391